MGNDHAHHHSHHHDVKNIKTAFFLNLAFTIIELIGGLFVNSVAILSDAIHDLGDSLSLGLSWYFQKLSKKGRDKSFSYGYKRFALLGAIINSMVLLCGSLIIIIETVPRIWSPEMPDTKGMILLSILGIVFNGMAVLKMKSGDSINEKVVFLHLLEDVLGWVAVLIGSLVMMYFKIALIDPLLSLMITMFILYNVYKNIKNSFRVILQGSPKILDHNVIKSYILTLNNVIDVHDFHTWSLDGSYHIATIHIVVKEGTSIEHQCQIKTQVRHYLKERSIDHMTIEIDQEEEICELENC